MMNGLFSGLYLLQANPFGEGFSRIGDQFGGGPSRANIPPYVWYIIGGLILVAILIGVIRGFIFSDSTSGGRSSRSKRISMFRLRRMTSSYGLSKKQTKFLADIFRINFIGDPERVLQNPAALDRVFKNAYKTIDSNSKSSESAQQLFTQLFAVRNIIEAAPAPGRTSGSRLAANTPAIITIGRENFPVKVISSEGNTVVTESPRNALGTPLRLVRGTNITLSFFTQSYKGFALDGRTTDSANTGRAPTLRIIHEGKYKALVKRNYRRRQININCDYYTVNLEVTGTGRKKVSRLVTGQRRMTGLIMDISAGGCSIKTAMPVPVDSRLKISLNYGRSVINVLGLLLRINRSAGSASIMHIKFTKVPRGAFNSISAIVYEYDED